MLLIQYMLSEVGICIGVTGITKKSLNKIVNTDHFFINISLRISILDKYFCSLYILFTNLRKPEIFNFLCFHEHWKM